MDADNISPDLIKAAGDPNTSAEYLRRVAYYYPDLRPIVAQNPAAYDGLLQWLADLGVEQAAQALEARQNDAESDAALAKSDEVQAGEVLAGAAEASETEAGEVQAAEASVLDTAAGVAENEQAETQVETEAKPTEQAHVEIPGEPDAQEPAETSVDSSGELSEAGSDEAGLDGQNQHEESAQTTSDADDATQVLPAMGAYSGTAAYGNWQFPYAQSPMQGPAQSPMQGPSQANAQGGTPADSQFSAWGMAPNAAPSGSQGFPSTAAQPVRRSFQNYAPTSSFGQLLGQTAQTWSQPAQPEPEPEPEPEKKSLWPTIVITVLTVLTVILAVFAVLLYTGKVSFSAQGSSTPGQAAPEATAGEKAGQASPTATEPSENETSTSPSPSGSPSASEQEVLFPAPAGSIEGTGFNTPSRNIMCLMREDYATCSVLTSEWTSQTMDKCSSDPQSVTVSADGSQLACDDPALGDGQQLEYNQTMVQGDMACSLTLDGVSCWNVRTGEAIAVAKRGWLQGSSGRIEPTEIP